MKDFRDKIVVITGAANGMGRAYAREFSKIGSKLALCDIEIEDLERVVEELAPVIGRENIFHQKVDVAKEAQVFEFAASVKKELGNAHVVINNAGVTGVASPFYHIEIDDFKRVMDINFYGVVYGSKAFLPQLVENNEGALVNVSSVFGLIAPANNSDYSSSKFAIAGFTRSLAVEFHKSPISIHCLHPGGINTGIIKQKELAEYSAQFLVTPPEDVAKYVIKSIKVNRTNIVYGSDSFKIRLAANFLPMKIFLPIAWKELKKSTSIENYQSFIPDILRKK